MTSSNRLIKNKTYIPGIAGQPYIAPRGARTVMETQRVCGYYPVDGSPPSGRFVLVPADPAVGRMEATYIWVTDTSVATAYSCRDQQVPVTYPATPGQPYIASRPSGWDYHLGWDGVARSQSFISGDGKANFQVRESAVGAIAGLNDYESPLAQNGLTIDFGWYCTRGTARVFESGVFKTGTWAYTEATVFAVRRAGSTVQYLMDGVIAYTSAATSAGTLWLQAALYSGDDEIFNPAMAVGVDAALPISGQLSITLPPPRATLGGVLGVLRLALPATVISALEPPWGSGNYRMGAGGGALTLRLPAGSMAAREGFGAALRMTLPQPALATEQAGLAAPSFTVLNLALPAPLNGFSGLIGVVGQLEMALPVPRTVSSDRPIGRLSVRLPLHGLRGRSWPYDELPGGDGRLWLVSAGSVKGLATLPAEPMTAMLSGAAAPYASVTLGTVTLAGLLAGSMEARSVVTLQAAPLVGVLSGRIDILSGMNELWVMNIDGAGTTQYDNYPFNSFAKIGGHYYGAGDAGLFLLEGPDDAGQPIAASFGLGELNFGSPQLKTVSHCYLGTAAGGMRLQVDALLNGAPASYTYPARGHGASMREVRFDMGRGLRSTYVQPTFYNADGAAFDVDAVSFLVAESARRI